MAMIGRSVMQTIYRFDYNLPDCQKLRAQGQYILSFFVPLTV
jgi:hypothetical protein